MEEDSLLPPTLEPSYSTAVISNMHSELQLCTHLHLFCLLPLSPSQWKTTFPQHRTAQFVFPCWHSQCRTSFMSPGLGMWGSSSRGWGSWTTPPLLCHYLWHSLQLPTSIFKPWYIFSRLVTNLVKFFLIVLLGAFVTKNPIPSLALQ